MLANNDLFADRRHLIDPNPPVWQPDTYGRDGKVYDGWETRRRRNHATASTAPDETDHDFALVRLGAPGVISTLVIDTAFFRGNYPPYASVEALAAEGYPTVEELEAMPWTTILPRSPLKGDSPNSFEVDDDRRWTHLRLTIYPDGGVARFRALGVGLPDPRLLSGTFDLACLRNGGRVVAVSDMFYSSAAQPDPARLGDEHRRRLGDGPAPRRGPRLGAVPAGRRRPGCGWPRWTARTSPATPRARPGCSGSTPVRCRWRRRWPTRRSGPS